MGNNRSKDNTASTVKHRNGATMLKSAPKVAQSRVINASDVCKKVHEGGLCEQPLLVNSANETCHNSKNEVPMYIDHEAKPSSAQAKSHEVSERLGYEEMVEIFKPLIIKNLLVREILPHLPFIEDHEDLYVADRRSPSEAVVCLLRELKSSKELGKWHKFLDALRVCGYEYIVQNIKGYRFINHKYQTEYLKSLTPKLSKVIRARELLPRLYAEDIISQNDREEIEKLDDNYGKIAAATMLLTRIPRKLPDWYTKFIAVLREEGLSYIADDLDIPHLTTSERVKASAIESEQEPKSQSSYVSQDFEYDHCMEKSIRISPPLPPPPPGLSMTYSCDEEVYDTCSNTYECMYDPPDNRCEPLNENSGSQDEEYASPDEDSELYEPFTQGNDPDRDSTCNQNDKFHSLKREVKTLLDEETDLDEEIKHLKKKNDLQGNVIEKLKVKRELQQSIIIQEKEAAALKAPVSTPFTNDYNEDDFPESARKIWINRDNVYSSTANTKINLTRDYSIFSYKPVKIYDSKSVYGKTVWSFTDSAIDCVY